MSLLLLLLLLMNAISWQKQQQQQQQVERAACLAGSLLWKAGNINTHTCCSSAGQLMLPRPEERWLASQPLADQCELLCDKGRHCLGQLFHVVAANSSPGHLDTLTKWWGHFFLKAFSEFTNNCVS